MKFFFRKKIKKVDDYEFFDDQEDIDPWTSSSIDFFKTKKLKKNEIEKNKYKSEDIRFEQKEFEELSFPRLDASFESVLEKRKSNLMHNVNKGNNFRINENVKDKFENNKIRENLKYENIMEENDVVNVEDEEVDSWFSKSNLKDFHEDRKSTNNGIDSFNEVEAKINPNERMFERLYINNKKDININNKIQNNLEEDIPYNKQYNKKTIIHKQNDEYDFFDEKKINKTNEKVKKDNRMSNSAKVKIIFASLLLATVIFSIVLIKVQNEYSSNGEEVITIEAPNVIKVKPEKSNKPLVPYQDELIYGKIDESEKELDSGEHILPETEFSSDIPEIIELPENDESIDQGISKEEIDTEKEVNDEKIEDLSYSVEPSKKNSDDVFVEPIIESDEVKNTNSVNKVNVVNEKKPIISKLTKDKSELEKSVIQNNKVKKVNKTEINKTKKQAEAVSKKPIFVKIGSYKSQKIARQSLERLIKRYSFLRGKNLSLRPIKGNSGTNYILFVGPLSNEAEALKINKMLR